MTEEEKLIFDDIDLFGNADRRQPRPMGKRRAKRGVKKDVFAEIKTKMVMRIYGVTKARALEIIAGREAERKALEADKERMAKRGGGDDGGDIMSAADLFSL
jgi:hypothetical protein